MNYQIKHKTNKNHLILFGFKSKIFLFFILLLLCFFVFYLNYNKKPFYFDQYETYIYNDIKIELEKTKCSIMWANQREFLNGIIRKYKPKKIVEIGVAKGGSSIIILNAIKDLKNSHLYSIDLGDVPIVGSCVNKYFPYLSKKWTLFKGSITANYIEKIGKNIDLAFIDSAHFEPGEILDFLMILPFLKEKAFVIIHDIDHQITYSKGPKKRNEWAPYIIFNLIRGKKYLPSGEGILNKDIGVIQLEKNQKRFIHDYCRALGGQWRFFPQEIHIQLILKFFEKYYDNECLTILKETIEFNRDFVKLNPI